MLTIHTDGSCSPNPGLMGIGVLIEQDGESIEKISEEIGYGTNNIAEFKALIRALQWMKDNKKKNAEIFMDSKMIQEGYNKEWTYKKTPHLKKLQEECLALKRVLPFVTVNFVPREQNEKADSLSTGNIDYRTLNVWERIKFDNRGSYPKPPTREFENQTIERDLLELEMSYN